MTRASEILTAVGTSNNIVLDHGHVVWAPAGLYGKTDGKAWYAIVASITIPPAGSPEDGWQGDWAAFIGGAPSGLTLADALRHIRAWGDKLSEPLALVACGITDLPYRS